MAQGNGIRMKEYNDLTIHNRNFSKGRPPR